MPPEPSIWTPPVITAVVAGVVALLGALTTMIVTLAGLRKKADETALKVDGHLGGLRKDLEVANTEIAGLKALVAAQDKSKTVADDLAARKPPGGE